MYGVQSYGLPRVHMYNVAGVCLPSTFFLQGLIRDSALAAFLQPINKNLTGMPYQYLGRESDCHLHLLLPDSDHAYYLSPHSIDQQ